MRVTGKFLLVLMCVFQGVAGRASSLGDSADFTNIAVGGREAGMGETGAALSRGVYAPFWNVAGLGGSQRLEFSAMQMLYIEGINYGAFGYSQRLSDRMAVGAQLTILSASDVRRDMSGADLGDFQNGIYSLSGGISREFLPGLWIGGLVRGIHQQFDTEVRNFFQYDLGARYDLPDIPASLGFSTHNSSMTTPNDFRAGAAYTAWDGLVTFSVDALFPDYSLRGGAELALKVEKESFFLRAGYMQNTLANDLGGFTAGLGIKTSRVPGMEYAVDYSYVPLGLFGVVHQFSLTLQFTGVAEQIATPMPTETPVPRQPKAVVTATRKTKAPTAVATPTATATGTSVPTKMPTVTPTFTKTVTPEPTRVFPRKTPTTLPSPKVTRQSETEAPKGLKYKVLDNSRLQISWSPVSSPNLIGYNLFSIDPDQPEIREKVNAELLTEPSQILANVDRSTRYILIVAAVYAGGESNFSELLTVPPGKKR